MSKLKDLVAKYKISEATAKKFHDSDTTPTKKYLEYMIKMWCNRKDVGIRYTSEICNKVKEFEALLPYIKNKDIYSEFYFNFNNLKNTIELAFEEKDEKTFKREDHVIVIDETEDYLFLIPKTHKGSCKYGAKTKWCTSSKYDSEVFKRYIKNGCLAYLISKKEDKGKNYNKVAFYLSYCGSPYSQSINIYNSTDQERFDKDLLNANWEAQVIFKLISLFRAYASNSEKIVESKNYIDNICLTLTNINIIDIDKHIKVVESSMDNDYISNIKNTFDGFLNKIKTVQNEYTKA